MKGFSLGLGTALIIFGLFFLYRIIQSMLFFVWYFLPLGLALLIGFALLRYGLKRKRSSKSNDYFKSKF